jgi:hypothetical protein
MNQKKPGMVLSNTLPYRKLQLGRDYWIKDKMLPNAQSIVERCLVNESWMLGQPWRNETWPGMRCPNALLPDELQIIEDWVKEQTGATRLWQEASPDFGSLSHNFVQLVGGTDSGPRPHTDSRKLCRYAAVLYLSPNAPKTGGTTFYRLRLPNGALGGNTCPPPHANLREALGVTGLPLAAWKEDISIPNVFNRLLLYKADIVHSASSYFGSEKRTKRMTVVFFWMAS